LLAGLYILNSQMYFGTMNLIIKNDRKLRKMKTVLITGIGGLTPRSIAANIKENHPDYRLVGCDVYKKAVGFFMKTKTGSNLIDKYYVAPGCDETSYFSWMESLVKKEQIDYAFVQPEWGQIKYSYNRPSLENLEVVA